MTGSGSDQPESAGEVRHALVVAVVTVLVCLPILGVAQYVAHVRYDEYDQWLFAYYGQQLLEGRELYSELWDNKPPGIFWINAIGLWVSGGRIAGPITLCALASIGACAIVFALARRLYGWAAAGVATVLAAVYLFVEYYHVGCNRPSTFLVVTELAAALFYVRSFGAARRPRLNVLLAGCCAGLSLYFRQTGLAVAAGIAVHQAYLLLSGAEARRQTLRRGLLFAAGWASAGIAGVVLLVVTSDLGWAWDAFGGFVVKYLGSRQEAWCLQWFGLREHVRALALPAILSVATVVQPVVRRLVTCGGRSDAIVPGHHPRGLLVMLWSWLLAGVVLAQVAPVPRMHHWGIALPPLVMLASHGAHLLLSSGRSLGTQRPAFHVVVGVLWMAYMLVTPLEIQGRAALVQRWRARDESERVRFRASVEAIRAVSEPGDRLFVWDYHPKLYWASGRAPAIRYYGTLNAVQLGAKGQPLMDSIIALLKTTRPKVIAAFPRSLGRGAAETGYCGLRVGDFPQWLRANYSQPAAYEKQRLWVRRD